MFACLEITSQTRAMDTPLVSTRRARLREFFKNRGIPPKEKSYISQLMSGKSSFGERAARRLERDYGMGSGYLDQIGDAPSNTMDHGMVPIAVWEHPEELPDGEFIKVPRLDVRLSAGNGCGEQPEVDLIRENPQVFRSEWARRERLKPAALASMYAHGRSMEPRICDGDSLLVDTSQTIVLDGRVYAIWYAGELRVKRLFKRIDGGITINSDNDDFPRVDVLPDEMEHVRIIGRVVHVQGTGGL